MDIILLQDVEHVGLADTIVSVKPGFGNNYLIPQGLGVVANDANRAQLANRLRAQELKDRKMKAEFEAIANKIKTAKLVIKSKAGTSGKIFGSINTVQLAAALRDAAGVDVERRKLALLEEVKTLGTYNLQVTLSKEVVVTVPFEVVNEDASVQAEAAGE